MAHAARLLRAALAALERAPGRALRPGCAPLLHLRPGPVSAGFHLPHGAADHQRLCAVPLHGGRGAAVVRLCLSADGLHRDLHVGGAPPGGEATATAASSWTRGPGPRRKLLRKGGKHLAWGAIGLWTGVTFVGYFTPIRSLVGAVAGFGLGPWETFWVLFYGFRDLRQRRLHARAGLQVHVPLCALPERDVRQGHADHQLRRGTRRAARRRAPQACCRRPQR